MPTGPVTREFSSVLIVDDEASIRSLCVQVLERHGFRTFTASDAAQAFEIHTAYQPDMLLSDISMPGNMDGVDLAQKVLERSPASRVVLMTGFHASQAPEDRVRGICSLLPKPFTAAQLLTAVRECLQSSKV
jgi:DNA-binding NtrC family response regulator